jgi:purine-binding chemotaxis protein CheW
MQYCTFTLDGMTFGVQVSQVQEAIRHQEMTPVPMAPDVVGGLLNLRGQIVTAVDLRRRLGLAERPSDQRPMNVVVRTSEGAVSLLVDQIGDVVEMGDAELESVPDTTDPVLRSNLIGACQLPAGLVLVLDTTQVLAPPEPLPA